MLDVVGFSRDLQANFEGFSLFAGRFERFALKEVVRGRRLVGYYRPRSLRRAAQDELERDPPQHTWLPEGCEDAPPERDKPQTSRFPHMFLYVFMISPCFSSISTRFGWAKRLLW